MKKIMKRALVLLLAATLLCGLCGCTAIDEMRDNQAFFDDAGNIALGGKVYKLLPLCEYLSPQMDDSRQIYLTDSDVPVLLSGLYAKQNLYISKDRSILVCGNEYYCIAEQYDTLCRRIQDGFEPEAACYYYYAYNEQTWEYEETYYTLSQEQEEAIELVVTTVEPVSYNKTGISPEYDYFLDIYECSEDMLFQSCSTQILVKGDRYFVLLYTPEDQLTFAVPDGCNEIFSKIVSAYENAMGYMDVEVETEV